MGFDQLFDMLERGQSSQVEEGLPSFDIEQHGSDSYIITLAVPGYREEQLQIIAQQNQLTVSGQRPEGDESRYLHRNIAARPFERRFALGDFIKVQGAELRDGLLSISLARESPEGYEAAQDKHRVWRR